jgi:hypothetical protein
MPSVTWSMQPNNKLEHLTLDEARELLNIYRPPPPPSVLEWAKKYRAIGGRPFSLDRYPCLVPVYLDKSPFIIVEKPNQVGISEWLLNVSLHALDCGANAFNIGHIKDSLNVGYIFPAWTQLRDFSKDRIRSIAGETEYLTDLLSPIRYGPLRRESDLGLYFIGKSAWYLRGAHRPDDQLASFPVDILIIDEYDLITERAVSLAEKRLRASPLRLKRYVSKPSIPNVGIDKLFQESDQHVWQLRCRTCGEWQVPDFWQNVVRLEDDHVEDYTAWSQRENEELLRSQYQFACRSCRQPMNPTANGRWVALNPGSMIRGYRIPGLVAPFVPLAEVVKGSLAEEPDVLLEWYRGDLGIAKSPEGGQLSWDELEACNRDYNMVTSARRCSMGVDVGVKLHVRIGCHRNGEWQALWIGTVDEFEDLDKLMKSYHVRTAIIDAQPETRQTRNFCKRWPGRAWMAYYYTGEKPPAVLQWKEAEGDEAGQVTIARTEMMDRVAAAHREARDGLPANARYIQDFYKHMISPVRVMTKREKQDGTRYNVAVYLDSGPDHYYHASVYERSARDKVPAGTIPTSGLTGPSSFT